MIDLDKLRADLIRDEGCVLHAYPDHLGYTTIGVGRLIDPRRGGGISQKEAEYLLDNDIARTVGALDIALPWFRGLSDARQRALANMAFQMGVSGLLGFRNMLAALERGDYEAAVAHAVDSRWARQTPDRAQRVTALLRL